MYVKIHTVIKLYIFYVLLFSFSSIFLFIIEKELYGLSVGNDFLRFNPSPSAYDFISVESSFTTQSRLVIVSSLVEQATSVLPVTIQSGIDTKKSQDQLIVVHNGIAWGITSNLEGYIRAPVIIDSFSKAHPSNKGKLSPQGLSYIGLGGKYRIDKWGAFESALGMELGTDLMDNNPYIGTVDPLFGSFAFPIVTNIYLAIIQDHKPILVGANIGYRYRTVGEPIDDSTLDTIPIYPNPHTFNFALAVSARSAMLGNLVFEINSSYYVKSKEYQRIATDRSQLPVEVLLGYFYTFYFGLGVKLGVSKQVISGVGSADWRFFGGVDYALNLDKLIYSKFR